MSTARLQVVDAQVAGQQVRGAEQEDRQRHPRAPEPRTTERRAVASARWVPSQLARLAGIVGGGLDQIVSPNPRPPSPGR